MPIKDTKHHKCVCTVIPEYTKIGLFGKKYDAGV